MNTLDNLDKGTKALGFDIFYWWKSDDDLSKLPENPYLSKVDDY